jgi:hypothetical protein
MKNHSDNAGQSADTTQPGPGEYKCCFCGGIYGYGWTAEEAKAEYEKNFGRPPEPEDGVCCDDCYNKFMRQTFN